MRWCPPLTPNEANTAAGKSSCNEVMIYERQCRELSAAMPMSVTSIDQAICQSVNQSVKMASVLDVFVTHKPWKNLQNIWNTNFEVLCAAVPLTKRQRR